MIGKKNMTIMALGIGFSLLFTGCSKMFNMGYDKSVCEEEGCDYRDAGVCGNSYDIYKNWRQAKKRAYLGYSCKDQSTLEEEIVITK